MLINTGTPRSIQGHIISGSVIGLVLSGATEYANYQQNKITKQEALNNTLKAALQGGIITAAGIGAANAIGDNTKSPIQNTLEAGAYIVVGMAAIYAINTFLK